MNTGFSRYLSVMEAQLENLSKDQLIALLKEQRTKMDELEKKDIRQTSVITHMEHMINKLRRLHFGTKSERFIAENLVIANQLNLPFEELAAKAQHGDSEETVKETITYTRKKNENHKGRNRLP